MRHLKAGRRLGVTTSHRRAMMRNMVTSILEKGEIRCTLARAKEVRKPLEKMITLAKRGDLHARRQALSFVKSKEAMSQLFDELSERYSDRQGGYCRIIKLGQTRLGDNSEMAIVQLIGSENDQLSSLKSTSGKKKSLLPHSSQKQTGLFGFPVVLLLQWLQLFLAFQISQITLSINLRSDASDTALFRWSATVVGNRGDVMDGSDP